MKKPAPKKRWVRRIIGYSLLGLLLYMILGATLPFARFPEVSQEFQQSFSTDQFYSDTVGTDRAMLVETSQEALEYRLKILSEAKERILFSTFDMSPDQSGTELYSMMLAAADRGVKVQILVDGLSGIKSLRKDMKNYALGTHPNIEIRFYNFPNPLLPWTFIGRMHDKFICVDNQFLLLGGRNTSNYFLGEYNPDVLSYDRDVLIYNGSGKEPEEGSVWKQIEAYFTSLWDGGDCTTVYDSVPKRKEQALQEAADGLRETHQRLLEERKELFDPNTDYAAVTIPTRKVSLIYHPIHKMSKEPWVWYQLTQLMKEAESRVWIQTPYAVLNDAMYSALRSIGSDLDDYEMLTNSVAGGDNFMGSSDYIFNKEKILNTGITVYEFQGIHSMHNKSLLLDEDLSIIGSYNLDMRSTYLDTETMLIIHGEEFAQTLEDAMLAMWDQSLKVTPEGGYETREGVEPLVLSGSRKYLYPITSVVFQLFRFLL